MKLPPPTTREDYVTAKALAYAIKVIEALPVRWQEQSDMEDMKVILSTRYPQWEMLVNADAYRHLDGAAREAADALR